MFGFDGWLFPLVSIPTSLLGGPENGMVAVLVVDVVDVVVDVVVGGSWLA